MTARRQFIRLIPLAGLGALGVRSAFAQAMVDEKDPAAATLGYVADASKADKAKFKNYAEGQNCGNCSLYQGKDAPAGACPLFAGKQVAKGGWCSAYAKKAA